MSIQERRLEKGWSQEELAMHSGLSVRTIQRIESGRKAGLESLKCLAAVFETSISTLMQEQTMTDTAATTTPTIDTAERDAMEYVNNLRAFHLHWISFLVIMPGLYLLNRFLSPEFLWSAIVAGTWGLALVLHIMVMIGMFGVFGAKWEQREFRKRMNLNRR